VSEERTYHFEIFDTRSPLLVRASIKASSRKGAVLKLQVYYSVNPSRIDESYIVGSLEAEPEVVQGDVSESNRDFCETAPRIIAVGLFPGLFNQVQRLMVNYPIDWVHIEPGADPLAAVTREKVLPDYDAMVIHVSNTTGAKWRNSIAEINPPGSRLIRPLHNASAHNISQAILHYFDNFDGFTGVW
jgi:hypothetical protein